MKQLVREYLFDASARTVTLTGLAAVDQEALLIISNALDGVLIYNFADPALGATVSGNVITLDFDTTSMADTDPLTIFYEDESTPASLASITDLRDVAEAVHEAVEILSWIGGARGTAADLRVSLTNASVPVTGTVTVNGSLTTLTTLTTLSNMAAIGGWSANQSVPAAQNTAAVLSNITNVVVS